MKNNILMLWCLCAISLSAFAQDFKYAAIYDASGPVKEIKTDSKMPLVQKKVKIKENGMGGLSNMMYDNDGLPVGWEMNMMGKQNFQKFFWNEDSRLDSIAVKIDVIGNSELITVKNTYSGRDMISQVIEVKSKEESSKFIMLFSDYKFDDNGNWISRKVTQTEAKNAGGKSEQEFTETRTIKYYN